jgi:NAD(P)H dehydrogenase (quinone)
MAKILICYYTRSQHTKHMGEAIAQGAEGVEGAEVTVRPVEGIDARDLLEFDGIVMGSPTYYGTMAAQVKQLLDESVAIHGQLEGKVGGAFSSSGLIAGGNETTIMDILRALMIHGMIIRGTSHNDHYGPVAVGDIDDRSRKECVAYGAMVGELAVRLHG